MDFFIMHSQLAKLQLPAKAKRAAAATAAEATGSGKCMLWTHPANPTPTAPDPVRLLPFPCAASSSSSASSHWLVRDCGKGEMLLALIRPGGWRLEIEGKAERATGDWTGCQKGRQEERGRGGHQGRHAAAEAARAAAAVVHLSRRHAAQVDGQIRGAPVGQQLSAQQHHGKRPHQGPPGVSRRLPERDHCRARLRPGCHQVLGGRRDAQPSGTPIYTNEKNLRRRSLFAVCVCAGYAAVPVV